MPRLVLRSLLPMLAVAGALLTACVSGCTRGGTPPGGDVDAYVPPGVDAGLPISGNLRIDPQDHVVMLAGGASQTVAYRLFFRESAGASESEVTSEALFTSTVPDLGSFSGATFTTAPDRGGRTNIVATYRGMTTSTPLTIRLDRIVIGPGATADTPARFDGTATAGGPEIVYPDDGVMVPPNLGLLEIHYMPNGGEVFELDITTSALNLLVYFGCPESVGGGCIYTPERAVWETIATAAAGADPITYRLRSVNGAGEIRESEPRTIAVAQEPITGGLYYWNAGGGSIERFEFGVRGARAEEFIGRSQTGAAMCVGCHALSRDGTRISVGTDLPTTTFQVFDVATRGRVFSLGGGGGGPFGFPSQPNFATFSPDSREIATSFLTGLTIRSATDGSVITDRLGGGPASQPDWSPDGNHIVYAAHAAPSIGGLVDVGGVSSGRITIIDRVSSTEWSAPRTIVAIDGVNNYYPSYSPDGAFISFCRSPSNINSMGADPDSGESAVPDAELWLIPSDRSGAARQLTTIAGRADSWPKWDPTIYEHQGRPLYWMSWTSRRAYGLRLGHDQRAQIWMAAFDPTVAATGEQGFRAAFWLPFQNIETANHIPQWVTSVERQTCDDDTDCGGEFCVDGRCFEEEPLI